MKPFCIRVVLSLLAACVAVLTVNCTQLSDDETASLVGYEPVDASRRPWLSGRDLFFTYSHGDTTPAYIDTVTGDTIPRKVVAPDTIVLTGSTLCSLFVDTTLDTTFRDTCFLRIAAIPKSADTIGGVAYDTIWPLAFEIGTLSDFSDAIQTVRYLEHRAEGIYQRAWGDTNSRRIPDEQLGLPLNAQRQFSTDLDWTCSPMMPAPRRLASWGRAHLALLPGAGIVHFAGDTSIYDETYKLYDLVLLYAATTGAGAPETMYERVKVVFHRALELNPANTRFSSRVFSLRQVHTVMRMRRDGVWERRKEIVAVCKRR